MDRKISILGVFFAAVFTFALPSSARSNLTEDYNSLFLWITLISVAVFILVMALWVLFVYRFNENNEATERNPISHATARKLEFGWTAVAIVIVILLMVVSYPVLFSGVDAAEDNGDGTGTKIVVEGTANWQWKFHLGDGSTINPERIGADSVTTITLSTNIPYTFEFYSSAPWIHSFFVYDLNIKMDVVPGVNNTYTFEILDAGSYEILCAEFCGDQHSNMKGFIIAEDA